MAISTFHDRLSSHSKGFFAVLAAALLWSTGGIFIKLISLNAFQLSFFRSVFAFATIGFLFRCQVLKFNWLSILNSFFYTGVLIVFVMATKETTAANAIFLQYTAPVYVLLLEPLILKTKLERINIITIVACFLGMTLFFMGELSPGNLRGNIFALITGVFLAGFFLGQRKNHGDYSYSSIFWGNIFISIITFPSILGMSNLSLSDFGMVAFLGIFQIGLAYIIFSYGLKKVLSIEASLIAMIEPVLNPIWVVIWFGEKPSFYAIVGGCIILLAIALRTLIIEKKKRYPAQEILN